MFNPFKDLKLIYIILFVLFDVQVFLAAIAGNNFIFDEVYYAPASLDTLNGIAANIEHPPLVKLMVGGTIGLFGYNWLAWRLPIILCSLLAVGMTFLIARHFLSERLSTFAAALMCLSVIFVLIGSTCMLDVPCLAFGLLGVWLVLKGRYGWGGLVFGSSFLCKELAVLMFLVTFVYLFIIKVKWWRKLFFVAIAFLVAFSGVWMYDIVYQPKAADIEITNPVIHFYFMGIWQANLNGIRAPNATQWYPPIAWVTPFGNNAFEPLKWLWLEVGGEMVYCWSAQPNPMVEYLMFPLLFLLPVAYWFKRNSLALLCWLWIGASYLPWFVVGFFVRTEANFYVIFSLPFLAIGCAYLLSLVKNKKPRYGVALAQLLVGLAVFLFYFPLPLFN